MQKYRWEILNEKIINDLSDLTKSLLQNRNIKNIDEFLNPPAPEKYAYELLPDLDKSISIIKNAIDNNFPIIIHGDYDVDGQTATAILWRTIHNDLSYKNVFPYIPNRFDEGYGLSPESISGMKDLLIEKGFNVKADKPLLITVDCGIVSIKEVEMAKKDGFTVIISDHHHPKEDLPKADCLLVTEKATGAGISWLLSNKLSNKNSQKYLGLAAIGTICDLQPLVDFNRSITFHGLNALKDAPIAGINALKKISGIEDSENLNTYHIGWQLGPRLNATGRLESAMDSLRILCTDSDEQALELASRLNSINTQRQNQTLSNLDTALKQFENIKEIPKFILSHDNTYHEGVIGLVAGKLTQYFYRPSIAISIEKDSDIAKGSARSIPGISIIESLRKFEKLFINVGGHEMAAGFSIKKSNIPILEKELNNLNEWPEEIFSKKLIIDAQLDSKLINESTITELDNLKPFGAGNYEPVFYTKDFKIINFSIFGKENNHLRLFLETSDNKHITAIAFGDGYLSDKIDIGNKINIAYNLSINTWNGNSNVELKVKDISNI